MWVLIVLSAAALPALACSCRSLSPCELIRQPTLFIGEVIDGGVPSLRDDPWHTNADHVRFKIIESFRGLPWGTQTVDVEVMPTFGMCAANPYFPGRRYLVAPGRHDGKLREGVCFTGRDVEFATEEVGKVREYFARRMPLNVHGSVAATDRPELVQFLLSMGEAKRLPGVTVSTSHRGKIYSAVSRPDGVYTLPLPAAGVYRLTAALSPYQSAAADVSVPAAGCTIHDFGLEIDNTVSGRVWDEKGQPVKRAKVG